MGSMEKESLKNIGDTLNGAYYTLGLINNYLTFISSALRDQEDNWKVIQSLINEQGLDNVIESVSNVQKLIDAQTSLLFLEMENENGI